MKWFNNIKSKFLGFSTQKKILILTIILIIGLALFILIRQYVLQIQIDNAMNGAYDPNAPLLFINLIPADQQAAFTAAVKNIATQIGLPNPNFLMINMWHESGMNPAIYNEEGSDAVGLIQFEPSTAAGLNTTTDALAAMTATEQLQYVLAYYLPYAGKLNSYTDLYLVDFYPAALGQPDSYVFPFSAQAYADNAPMDTTGKGYITMADFKAFTVKNLSPSVLQVVNYVIS